MKTFLRKTAEHLWAQHSIEEMQEIAVVMPSQRGVLYLKKELAYLSDRPFLAPDFMTIEEFALKMTDSTLIDPIELLFEAYNCFKEVDPLVDFDRFMGWGQMMLKDFDTLDMYLVEPYQIFSFLSEVKSLERWGAEYGEEDTGKYITQHTKAYFKLYDHLLEVYGRLQARLKDRGLAYRGMAYRDLAARLAANGTTAKQYKKIYFVGFNALSKGEEEIIRALLKQDIAETLWDADEYYVKNSFHRAGNWLRNYADAGSNKYLAKSNFQWMEQHFAKDAKEVEVLGVANPSAQVFVAMELIRQWQAEYGAEEQVALVLGDESLLDQVLLFVGEFKDRLNITMGYSLKKTPVFSFITLLGEIHKRADATRIPVGQFRNLMQHALMQYYLDGCSKSASKDLNRVWQSLMGTTDLYVSIDAIQGLVELPVLALLFKSGTFPEILKLTSEAFGHILEEMPKKDWGADAQALTQARRVIDNLADVISLVDEVSVKIGFKLLLNLVQQQKLTFEVAEQKNRTLHVMGLLETRTLDFDRVIVLSLNEGSLPGTRKRESLIPLDIAQMNTFDLPTFTQADAVTSYHFHRLLQRPKQIELIYVQPSEKSSVKEMSRFIKQLRLDWVKQNPALKWTEPHVRFDLVEQTIGNYVNRIEKSDTLIAQLKNNLSLRGLSPSAMAQFANCSLQYYYSYVLNLRKEKQYEDELGADVFGTWVHKVLENVDKEILESHAGWVDQADAKWRIDHLDELLDQAMAQIQEREGVFEMEKGFNYVLKEVAKTILTNYYKAEVHWNAGRVQLLDTEMDLETLVPVNFEGDVFSVKLKGRVDRLDRVDGKYRIIDYKTGKVETKDLTISTQGLMADLLSADLKGKLLQLWLYKFLLAEAARTQSNSLFSGLDWKNMWIEPGIISFRNLDAGVLSVPKLGLWFSEEQNMEGFMADSTQLIQAWVDKMMDRSKPFEKTSDVESCQFCDFKVICHREI
ncbi:PD-(D/E)XK nuclease family protein [Aquirufa sp. TARAVU-A1A]